MLADRLKIQRDDDALPPDPGIVVREIRLVFHASPIHVRRALQCATGALAGLELSDDDRSSVELVLAEVMNNIVEHAHADGAGEIELILRESVDGLLCTVRDDGRGMPGGAPPAQRQPDPEVAAPLLQEGGFGWFLIGELASKVSYRRVHGRNTLALLFAFGRPPRPC